MYILLKAEFLAVPGVKTFKHKNLERYYIGKLSEKGFPTGIGVAYQAQSYLYHGFFNVLPQGEGTLQLFHQNIIYEGAFQEGKAHG